MDENYMEEQWRRHCFDGFPRAVSYDPNRFRIPVRNFDNLKWHVWKAFGTYNIYVDVYPEKNILGNEAMLINKIYIDLDNDKADPNEKTGVYAYEDMRAIVRFFKDQYNYTPRVYYSGGRGYAVYLDFDEVLINHCKDTLTEFYVMLKEQLGLKTIDTTSVGDDRRISRMPYTMHKKSGRLCTPIDPMWSLSQIMGYSDSFVEDLTEQEVIIGNCPDFGESLRALDDTVNERIKERERRAKELPTVIPKNDNANFLYSRYFDEVTRLFNNGPIYAEGRHRTLWCVLVPRMLYLLSGEGKVFKELPEEQRDSIANQTEARCMEWVLSTPTHDPDGSPRKTDDNYRAYIRAIIRQHKQENWHAWNIDTFFLENPELAKYWRIF